MSGPTTMAPPLETSVWLNTEEPIVLEALSGKVVLLEAFQMLCPGCVSHALPQAMRAREFFRESDVAVIGLHTVFEHHGAQGSEAALKAFLHEYRIRFPVGIDVALGEGNLPKTMRAYQMRGTPTTILIDRYGRLRKQTFGAVEDMVLGAELMSLLSEADIEDSAVQTSAGRTEEGCIPAVRVSE